MGIVYLKPFAIPQGWGKKQHNFSENTTDIITDGHNMNLLYYLGHYSVSVLKNTEDTMKEKTVPSPSLVCVVFPYENPWSNDRGSFIVKPELVIFGCIDKLDLKRHKNTKIYGYEEGVVGI